MSAMLSSEAAEYEAETCQGYPVGAGNSIHRDETSNII
jgi:hypothetical protein